MSCRLFLSVSGGADHAFAARELAGDDPPLLRPGGVRDVPRQGEGVQEQTGQFSRFSYCLAFAHRTDQIHPQFMISITI